MEDKSHEPSDFVVCRACKKYFFVHEIMEHQGKEHEGHEWQQADDPYRRFYHLTNSEVVFYLNRLREIRTTVNELRFLLL
jgi:hypothetical protein